MAFSSVINLVGEVAGAWSSEEASKRSARVARQSRDWQKKMYYNAVEALAPYMQSGEAASAEIQKLMGFGGGAEQQQAIDAIMASPAFQSQMQAGESAILQRASATGGLRGGDVQAALGQFRPMLLANEINNRYAKLAELAKLGQSAAVNQGAQGITSGQLVGETYMQQGISSANAAISQGKNIQNILSGFSQALGQQQGSQGQQPAYNWNNDTLTGGNVMSNDQGGGMTYTDDFQIYGG